MLYTIVALPIGKPVLVNGASLILLKRNPVITLVYQAFGIFDKRSEWQSFNQ